jgi:AAA family ATP:ADP antiporter
VLIINTFRNAKSRSFYGVIMAGGSLGALFGSEISKRFASSFNDFGLELFCLSATILLSLAMITGRYLTTKAENNQKDKNVGGSGLDGIKNVIKVSEIRSIAIYVWIWTGLMTVHWMTAITIIDGWSQDPEERIVFFSLLEQIVTPLTLIMQLFLTNIFIKYLGVKKILMTYGLLFMLVFVLYGTMPSITIVAVATVTLRLFEYGLNKPTRETVYSTLAKNDRYKSSVFIDTFVSRLGDLSGSSFIGLGKFFSVGFSTMPLIAIPIAGVLSLAGLKISKNERLKDF